MSFIKRVGMKTSNKFEVEYYHELPVIKWFQQNEGLVLSDKLTIISGENGQGKSTFIEALAVAMGVNHEGGSQQFNFSTRRLTVSCQKNLCFIRQVVCHA